VSCIKNTHLFSFCDASILKHPIILAGYQAGTIIAPKQYMMGTKIKEELG